MEKINILLVDDRQGNLIALESLVKRDDVNIFSTTSPHEGLRMALELDIAIAMVDVKMPEIDGFEFVNLLKSNLQTKDILVIFVTAMFKDTKHLVRGLNLGAVDYLYKPLNPLVTAAKVDSFIQIVRHQQNIRKKNKELQAFQKELVRAKEEAERSKSLKENFLANMSHELRTPINGIIGLTKLLHDTNLTEDQREMIRLLALSSSSLLGVVNDILDLSKIEAGKFKIVKSQTALLQNCNSILNLLKIEAKEKGLELLLEFDEELPDFVMADSLRLNQILINLVANAIKFTLFGAVILKVILCAQKGNNVQIKFSVCDTGIGISKENLEKIFDTFEQGDAQTTVDCEGIGLGLSLVKELVKLKGGELEAKSTAHVGSCFSYTNWYKIAKPRVKKTFVDFEELGCLKNARILIAEDNIINAFVIKRIFKQWDIDYKIVGNGAEVLDELRSGDYQLILMDTFMPVMNGLEATRLIRAGDVPGKENIPIISFSSSVLDADKNAALSAGANDVVSKPFDVDVLYRKINRFLSVGNYVRV
ncbi:response regulator [Pedobacter gandavensis]|uniref:response regulator n=1 Tax=Pedobacter gandavensis TaxID=2679963 RepID=UPI00293080D9|nr:response regulator [Pedobacter gandavensis]